MRVSTLCFAAAGLRDQDRQLLLLALGGSDMRGARERLRCQR
jgi:hypothetical protein